LEQRVRQAMNRDAKPIRIAGGFCELSRDFYPVKIA
jgi:hypothetical protein